MPHLVILYTKNLDAETDMPALCRILADTILSLEDDAGQKAFPVGGTRVLAYPAGHSAVADGERDCAFAYFNMRMAQGRSAAFKQRAGEALVAAARDHLAPVLARRPIGLTLQIDEGMEAFDGKFGNLMPRPNPD